MKLLFFENDLGETHEFYLDQYEDFENLWDDIPKNSEGELNGSWCIEDLEDINYSNTKEELEFIFNASIEIDEDYTYDQKDMILNGMRFFVDKVSDLNSFTFDNIINSFFIQGVYSYEVVEEYLVNILCISSDNVDKIIDYIDINLFIEDHFYEYNQYCYFK